MIPYRALLLSPQYSVCRASSHEADETRKKNFKKEEANTVTLSFAASIACFLSEYGLINNVVNLYLEWEIF